MKSDATDLNDICGPLALADILNFDFDFLPSTQYIVFDTFLIRSKIRDLTKNRNLTKDRKLTKKIKFDERLKFDEKTKFDKIIFSFFRKK